MKHRTTWSSRIVAFASLILAAGSCTATCLADSGTPPPATATATPTPAPGSELLTLDQSDLQYVASVALDNLQQAVDQQAALPYSQASIAATITSTCSDPAHASPQDLAETETLFTMFPVDRATRGLGDIDGELNRRLVQARTTTVVAPPAPNQPPKPVVVSTKPLPPTPSVRSQLAAYKAFDASNHVDFKAVALPGPAGQIGRVLSSSSLYGQHPLVDIIKSDSMTPSERAALIAKRAQDATRSIPDWWRGMTVGTAPTPSGPEWVVYFPNYKSLPAGSQFLLTADPATAAAYAMDPQDLALWLKHNVLDSMHQAFRGGEEKTDDQLTESERDSRAADLVIDADTVYQLYKTPATQSNTQYALAHSDLLWGRYVADFEHAIQLNPSAVDYYTNFAAACKQEGETKQAVDLLQQTSMDPTTPAAVKSKIDILLSQLRE